MKAALKGIAACWLICAIAVPALSAEPTPAGSFLKYRATTVSELATQVARDTTVKMRYAIHFGISPDAVENMVSRDIKLVSTKKAIRVHSWYVNKYGRMTSKSKLLPKGALVFASKDGTPLLAWSCGNPLQARVPTYIAKRGVAGGAGVKVAGTTEELSSPTDSPTMTASSTDSTSAENTADANTLDTTQPETKVLGAPTETIAAAAVAAPPGIIEEVIPSVAAAVPVAAVPAIEALSLPSVAIAPALIGGSSIFSWLAPLAGLGGAVALSAPPTTTTLTPGPEVPEPSTVAALATGFAALGGTAFRFRRKS